DICQRSVVLLGVRPLLACYVAVKMVRMSAVFDTVGSRGKVPTTKLMMLLTLMESASRTQLRTLVMLRRAC
ncbi:hypothetical protein ORY94_03485, partial [Enterococcus casseliflavus]|nr:hypothetical protein [Enterococcus casseliflavus]